MKNLLIKSILVLSIAFIHFSCKKSESEDPKPVAETGSVYVYFDSETLINGEYAKLNLDASGIADSTTALENSYTNSAGNKITINKVRYWVSNIVLIDSAGKSFSEPNSYHLIEYLPTNSTESILITGVPAGNYSKISYSIGVDSVPNHDLTKKAGDLSETIDMSWTWNTGYVFMKIEGRYEISSGKYANYTFHVGTDANYKKLSFDLPEKAIVTKSASPELHFKANILGVFGTTFTGSTNLDLKQSDNSMMDLNLAATIANNYGLTDAVFKLDHVHQAGE